MKRTRDAESRERDRAKTAERMKNVLENIFVVVLAFYPLRHIAWGLDLWDTGYNYANFEYMGTRHMDPMWLFSTYLANGVGSLISKLPNAGSLLGMNLYTGLFVSILALTGFLFSCRVLKMPLWIAFVGEIAAVSLCWCPTALLYNYLTYVLLLGCVLLLYQGLTREKKWCLFGAGVCLGANVLVRFSNLPEAVLILAVWAYDLILWREHRRTSGEEGEKKSFRSGLLRHTLWCLMGYLSALAVLFGYIHLRYGLENYAEGIRRLFAMTDKATDYKAASMLMGMINTYVENMYWVKRIGVLAAGGMILLLPVGWMRARLDRSLKRAGGGHAGAVKSGARFLMGAIRIVFSVLLGLGMIGWLYFRGFCSWAFYSYDSILRPGVLFLMLTMLIAAVRILYPKSPKEEKLIGGLILLVVLVTSIGSNNGVYPSLNNLFLAAPYTFWQSFRFLRYVSGMRIRRMEMSLLPVKGLLTAFLVLCLFQFGMFGVSFVFAEGTGVQDPDSYVENNQVLERIRMNEEKARWMTELSAYVEENGLQGQEVILYGNIPALSYYLQMPSAFNPWCDLDSYSAEQMKLDLAATAEEIRSQGRRPAIIVERNYVTYLEGGSSALRELLKSDSKTLRAIEEDGKWPMLADFMEQNGYRPDYSNEKFTVYR